MAEKTSRPESMESSSKKIKFLNVLSEGTAYMTFIHCPTPKADMILYGMVDNYAEVTHEQLFREAVEGWGFNEDYEPVGGGLINLKTCEILPSILFGRADESIEKAALYKAGCESEAY